MGSDVFSSGISLPAFMYEPLTILQRTAEVFEHHSILDTAAQETDLPSRIAYVAAFAISAYGTTNDQRTKTNFNPILGETFEFTDNRTGLRFFAEQVSHHPPVSALHVHGPNRKWQVWQNSSPQTKFLGNSLDINTRGRSHVYFSATNDHIAFSNPHTRVHNLILGRMWFEHFGDLKFTHSASGVHALVTFKKAGLFQGVQHDIEGYVRDSKGEKLIRISGAWDSHVKLEWLKGDRKGEVREVFRNDPKWLEPYYMSTYAASLNSWDARMRRYLLPSDARRRPDRMQLELRAHDQATAWKKKLEEQQRQERKARLPGQEWRPMWFAKAGECSPDQKARWQVPADAHDEEDLWVYVGDYWEQREQRLLMLSKKRRRSNARSKGKEKGENEKLNLEAFEVDDGLDEDDYYDSDGDKDSPLRPRSLKGTAADFMQHQMEDARSATANTNTDSERNSRSETPRGDENGTRKEKKPRSNGDSLDIPKDRSRLEKSGSSKGKSSKSSASSHERQASNQ